MPGRRSGPVRPVGGRNLAGALANALSSEEERLPAILTFVTAASGITIMGIGAAFWGLVAGIVLLVLLHWRDKT